MIICVLVVFFYDVPLQRVSTMTAIFRSCTTCYQHSRGVATLEKDRVMFAFFIRLLIALHLIEGGSKTVLLLCEEFVTLSTTEYICSSSFVDWTKRHRIFDYLSILQRLCFYLRKAWGILMEFERTPIKILFTICCSKGIVIHLMVIHINTLGSIKDLRTISPYRLMVFLWNIILIWSYLLSVAY